MNIVICGSPYYIVIYSSYRLLKNGPFLLVHLSIIALNSWFSCSLFTLQCRVMWYYEGICILYKAQDDVHNIDCSICEMKWMKIYINLCEITSLLCFGWQLATAGILFSACPCVCVWSCINSLHSWYLTNCAWEFHQIYNTDAVGDRDELFGFWDQKVKGQGHGKVKQALWWAFSRHLHNAWTYFNETCCSCSLQCPYDLVTYDMVTLSRSWVQRSGSQTILSENALSWRGIRLTFLHQKPSSFINVKLFDCLFRWTRTFMHLRAWTRNIFCVS